MNEAYVPGDHVCPSYPKTITTRWLKEYLCVTHDTLRNP